MITIFILKLQMKMKCSASCSVFELNIDMGNQTASSLMNLKLIFWSVL